MISFIIKYAPKLQGWFLLDRVIDTPVHRTYWLWEKEAEHWDIYILLDLVKHYYYSMCLQWTKDVDYLLIAKPIAINHSEIRRDCAHVLRAAGCW